MNVRQAVAGRLPVFVAGLYCVIVAVVPVGWSHSAPPAARAATWLCLLSLPLGLLVPAPRMALFTGTVGVLGGATAVFATVLWAGGRVRLPPLGILGFFALSLAWGALSSPAARPGVGQGVAVEWLAARRRVPRIQVALASTMLLSLPLLLLPPLWVESPERATFSLIVALGVILLLARMLTDGFSRAWLADGAPRVSWAEAARTLVLFLLVLLAAWLVLRA